MCKQYITVVFLLFVMPFAGHTQSHEPPNIVLILADDLGYGDIGAFGQELIQTPHLDRMADEGMTFTQFYSGSTVCAPSRASLFTGQHTGTTFIRGNGDYPLKPDTPTVSQILQQKGYATAMFGKWGLGGKGTTGEPQQTGWEHFRGHLHHVEAHFQQPDSIWALENGELQRQVINPQDNYANELFTRDAVEFISRQQHEQPFFLYLSLSIPHAELVVPEQYMELYLDSEGNSIYKPENYWPDGHHYGEQSYPKAAYAALVNSIDTYVGRVLDTLRKRGMDKNTLVIFTSDNGTHLEGGRTIEDAIFFNSSGSLRGVKRDLYEGGIRVPTIAWWPGKVSGASESDHIGAFWDILPTFAKLAGADAPQNVDGLSLVPVLLGEENQQIHEYLYWEFHEQEGKQAVRMGEWKGVRLNLQNQPDAHVELFNLADDPGETKDVSKDYPEVAEQILEKMKRRIPSDITNWNF